MNKFLSRICLFLLPLLSIVVMGVLLPATPRASKSLLHAKIQKDSLLINVVGPRIIFVGGSNLSFGLNSQLIKDSLLLNPINTAVHAKTGLQYMMNNTLQYIKKGDIVVVAPEYHHFYGKFIYGGEELLRTVVDINISDFWRLTVKQLINLYPYIPNYSYSKFKVTEYFGFKESDIYGVNSFNEYGDAIAHWELENRTFPMQFEDGPFNGEAINLLKEFKKDIDKKEATLYISYPCYQKRSFVKYKSQIAQVENELIKSNLILLGTSSRYTFADSLIFDSAYHLIKKGVDTRTQLLIEDIKDAQMHNNMIK